LEKNLTEVVEVTKSVMRRVNLLATLDTLKYLVKGGRVPKAAGLAGSLLQTSLFLPLTMGTPIQSQMSELIPVQQNAY